MAEAIKFMYKNHRGEIAERRCQPQALEYLFTPGFNYSPGWFLRCWDEDKKAIRSFALSNIQIDGHTGSGFVMTLLRIK